MIAMIIILASVTQMADAQTVPSWIKDNADLWVKEQISDETFVNAIGYLIEEEIIQVSNVTQQGQQESSIPAWVKNTAEFWVSGDIDDTEFLSAVSYLVQVGIITVGINADNEHDPTKTKLEAEIVACEDIKQAAKRSDCRKATQHALNVYLYKTYAPVMIQLGQVNYYWNGLGSDGNKFETSSTGQAILSIRMLAENTGSDNIALQCTSPQICNYDVWNGNDAFKYSGMDFTNGQIVLTPGQAKEFNMLFGPNIGYGGTQFVYDSSKDYSFRISESWGSAEIPLGLE